METWNKTFDDVINMEQMLFSEGFDMEQVKTVLKRYEGELGPGTSSGEGMRAAAELLDLSEEDVDRIVTDCLERLKALEKDDV